MNGPRRFCCRHNPDVRFLIKNAGIMSLAEIARCLGAPKSTVSKAARRFAVNHAKGKPWTEKEVAIVAETIGGPAEGTLVALHSAGYKYRTFRAVEHARRAYRKGGATPKPKPSALTPEQESALFNKLKYTGAKP